MIKIGVQDETEHEKIEKITSKKLRILPIYDDFDLDDIDFYFEEELENLLDNDEITPEENAFMHGYLGKE